MLPFPSTTTALSSNDAKPKQYTKLLTYPPNSTNSNATIQRSSNASSSSGASNSTTIASSTTSFTSLLQGSGGMENCTNTTLSNGTITSSHNTAATTNNTSNTNNARVATISSNSAGSTLIQLVNNGNSSIEKTTQQPIKTSKQPVRRSPPPTPVSASSSSAATKKPSPNSQSVKTSPPKKVEQTTRLSSDSALSVDIDSSKKRNKKRKAENISPDMNSYFQEEESTSGTPQAYTPSVYFAPPVFQSYDYYSYPQMMGVPQFAPTTSQGGATSSSSSESLATKPKQFESDEDYCKRRPIIAQYLEKKLGFTRYVLDRLDDRELAHQFIHSLVTAKDKTMMGSLCMSLLSVYLQEIKCVPVSDLSFQEGSTQTSSTHFNIMGASMEYSALISRILIMTSDPDCKPNKVADLLALSFMLIFNFGSYCRSGSVAPSSSTNKQ